MDGQTQKYFKIEKKPNYTLITLLTDRLDLHVAPTLKSELVLISGNGEKYLIIDLANVKYCDSAGLSALLVAHRLTKNTGGLLVIANLQKAVERLINISQLNTIFNIAESVEEAEIILNKHISKQQNQ